MPVYVHSKVMIIDDVFLTHGSAKINTRSMEVGSELNSCHENESVTQPLRQKLWNIHTKGMGAQDDPAEAHAEAICEAVARPNMRFVPIKNVNQQAVLALHRARQGFVRARTAQANQIRGLLGEFGLVIPRVITSIAQHVPQLIEDAANELPGSFRLLVQRLIDHLKELDRQVEELDMQIKAWHHGNDASRRLAEIPRIGPITASALVASIGDGKCFSNARQLAAWPGLLPRQHSSGGKPLLLGITKRGDTYLRTLMVHGGRAVVRYATNKNDAFSGWLRRLLARRHKNIAWWPWPTGMRESPGHCSHKTVRSDRITRRLRAVA